MTAQQQQFGYQVAVVTDAPLPGPLDYIADIPDLNPGTIVKIKLGKRSKLGVIVALGFSGDIDAAKCSKIVAILALPPLSSLQLAWAKWLSYYYQYPIGAVVALLLPEAWRSADAKAIAVTIYRLSCDPEAVAIRKPERRAILAELQAGQWTSLASHNSGDVRELLRKGYLEQAIVSPGSRSSSLPMAPYSSTVQPDYKLSEAQQQALTQHIIPYLTKGYSCLALEGATGSGKTEVYLQAAQSALALGRQVLILVPEISLIDQTVGRVRERFGGTVAYYHSGLTARERVKEWESVYSGQKRVVVGTRSSLFLPYASLGLIIVDEEHDQSYKQDARLRYHARDSAIRLAFQLGIQIVLGSATLASETLLNCEKQRYRYFNLGGRVSGVVPKLTVQDYNGGGVSQYLLTKLKNVIANKRQALLFINRRGAGQTLWCRACGFKHECPRCDNNLVLHAKINELRCHICDLHMSYVEICPECQTESLQVLGGGTEAIFDELSEQLPEARILRLDSDVVGSGNIGDYIAKIVNYECDIVVGTQMVVKGHHFPRLDVVGVINIDSGILSSDFRSLESTISQIFQVAGRAGREFKRDVNQGCGESSADPEVIVQSALGSHHFLQELARGSNYAKLMAEIMAARKEFGLPPYGYCALVAARAHSLGQSMNFLGQISRDIKAISGGKVTVLGPAPALKAKQNNWYHASLVVKCDYPGYLQQIFSELRRGRVRKPHTLHWHINIDPWSLVGT